MDQGVMFFMGLTVCGIICSLFLGAKVGDAALGVPKLRTNLRDAEGGVPYNTI